ncbi:hypothetical protein LX36DRAFT_346394 [Colletotrichum falcatum]|nr:hypothetical protein LX36DRAFT_346394 [Colletotrichum falcatum]
MTLTGRETHHEPVAYYTFFLGTKLTAHTFFFLLNLFFSSLFRIKHHQRRQPTCGCLGGVIVSRIVQTRASERLRACVSLTHTLAPFTFFLAKGEGHSEQYTLQIPGSAFNPANQGASRVPSHGPCQTGATRRETK